MSFLSVMEFLSVLSLDLQTNSLISLYFKTQFSNYLRTLNTLKVILIPSVTSLINFRPIFLFHDPGSPVFRGYRKWVSTFP